MSLKISSNNAYNLICEQAALLRNIDFTYFYSLLPNVLVTDRAVQGVLNRKWEQINSSLDCSTKPTLFIQASSKETLLFTHLFQTDKRIESIHPGHEKIKIRLKPDYVRRETDQEMPQFNDVQDDCERFYRLSNDSIQETATRSVRALIILSSETCEKMHYLGKLYEIALKIRQAIQENREEIFIDALGYDRIFLKCVIKEFFGASVRTVFPEPPEAFGSISLFLREPFQPSEQLIRELRALKTAAAEEADQMNPLADWSLQEFNNASCQSALDVAQKAYQLMTGKSIETPVVLHAFKAFTKAYLFQLHNTLSDEGISFLDELASKTTYAEFQDCLASSSIALPTEFTDNFAVEQFENGQKIKKTQKLIKKLSALKAAVESTIFDCSARIKENTFSDIKMEQVCRSYFPSDAHSPLVAIYINNNPFPLHESSRGYLNNHDYFRKLAKTLDVVSRGKAKRNQVYTKIAASITAGQELDNPQDEIVSLVLKAASFSSYGLADNALRKDVLKKMPDDYRVVAKSSREATVCELFLNKNNDFKTIRTFVYKMEKDHQKIAEIVVKWRVARIGGNWNAELQIPAVTPLPTNTSQEQKQIYSLFNVGSSSKVTLGRHPQ